MPTLLLWHGYRFSLLLVGPAGASHVHIQKDGCDAKVWLHGLEIAFNHGYNERELQRLIARWRRTAMSGLDLGMTSSEFETEATRPVAARTAMRRSCPSRLRTDGRSARRSGGNRSSPAPPPNNRATWELEFSGIWWAGP